MFGTNICSERLLNKQDFLYSQLWLTSTTPKHKPLNKGGLKTTFHQAKPVRHKKKKFITIGVFYYFWTTFINHMSSAAIGMWWATAKAETMDHEKRNKRGSLRQDLKNEGLKTYLSLLKRGLCT